MPRNLIVTADDLGLATEINHGILESHTNGIVTSASLLVNAPETQAGIGIAKANPGLEIGLHWSLVEGHCLMGKTCSLTDPVRYLGEPICLHRHWKPFLLRLTTFRLNLKELEAELELQAQVFLKEFPTVPFANGTQHMHLMPGVREIVIRLAKKYKIRALRIPSEVVLTPGVENRGFFCNAMQFLGQRFAAKLKGSGIKVAKAFAGFDMSGSVQADRVCRLLDALPQGTTELMVHPGYDCPLLRENLPWGYAAFNWVGELAAMTNDEVRNKVDSLGIRLIRFGDL